MLIYSFLAEIICTTSVRFYCPLQAVHSLLTAYFSAYHRYMEWFCAKVSSHKIFSWVQNWGLCALSRSPTNDCNSIFPATPSADIILSLFLFGQVISGCGAFVGQCRRPLWFRIHHRPSLAWMHISREVVLFQLKHEHQWFPQSDLLLLCANN